MVVGSSLVRKTKGWTNLWARYFADASIIMKVDKTAYGLAGLPFFLH
jgi:hypothetical protein